MDFASSLAEERIKEAIRSGEFNNLPGKGKPLELEDMSGIPEELRVGYKILKNAGVVPEEVQLKKEMMSIQDLLATCYDEKEHEGLTKRLNEKSLRFNTLMERRKMKGTSAFGAYRTKLMNRFR